MPLRENTQSSQSDGYPTWMGFIFIFNLIVGTGALTLPSVFALTGWFLGLILIVILAVISYICVTFVIESISCANAIIKWKRYNLTKLNSDENSDPSPNEITENEMEQTPLFSSQNSKFYDLEIKTELGDMAGLFFNNSGRILFYLCLAIYLYGDLSIYSAAVGKSLRDVICSKANTTVIQLETDLCWEQHTITRLDCYRLSVIGFITVLCPFVFLNVQKTKHIQVVTILLRWIAFTIMISIAVHRLFINGNEGNPPAANINGIPALFGACIYSFMCHHSLPSLITPIKNKKQIKSLLSLDYLLICCFYIFLALTGAFAFANLNDLYTLNFVPSADQNSLFLKIVEYFLALFPVFTLSASFPIIAITLRNNLKTLFLDTTQMNSYNFMVRNIVFPLLTIIPPFIVTFYTDNVVSLVGFTGSYAGTGIQYLIPIFLVYSARKTCHQLIGHGIVNEYKSPFQHVGWLIFVLVWAITCVAFVTVNFFIKNN